MTRALLVAWACVAAACVTAIDDADEIYSRGDGRRVLCGLGVDGESVTYEQLEAAMGRVAARDEVLILFAHAPGRTITHARLDRIFELAAQAGLPHVTFPELAAPGRRRGIAFGFDDAFVTEWFALRDLFARHAARVTFFISNYGELAAEQRDRLHALRGDGHAIEAHGMGHRNAPVYVEQHGLRMYLEVEIDPLLDAMRRDGFAPTTFAYPYGDRTGELDAALLDRFELVRSLSYLDRSVINSAPCPH